MSALRGFGMTFDVSSGVARNWYVDRDGAKRWADNDELCGLPAYDAVLRNFNEEWRKQEAENGICSDEDVCEEDREPPVLVGMFDPIPMPRDPYGCENPVSQSEEE